MEKKQILNAVKSLRKPDYKKKFSQTFDVIINLKNLNLKKPEEKVDIFMQLPNGRGKKASICAFVDDSMVTEAKKVFDQIIDKSEFQKYAKDKKATKKLASQHDFFVAQANLMPDIAKAFGRILGQQGKMPNPKAGCIVPPKAALQPIYDRLQNTIRLQAKNELAVKCAVGSESMADEKIAENADAVFDTLLRSLPQGDNNIKSFMIKLTMSPALKVGDANE